MTQSELAELTGISQAAISRFDKNGQHVDAYLVAISRSLNVSIEDLFEIEEQLLIDFE
jgi:transcriptional regulator with XRE-family HTH domain